MIRSKGLFWLASRPKQALIWGQAGDHWSWVMQEYGGQACLLTSEYDMPFLENQKMIESDWDSLFGDRKNEIVFIGQNINKA